MVFIDNENIYFGRAVVTSAENDGENAEENNRQNETQDERAPVAAQRNHGGANDGGDQSRNSLPVKRRKTDSRFGLRSETSSRPNPAFSEASSRPPISVGCSIVNCAEPSTA